MHRAFCIFLVIAATPTAWTKTQWSKEIPDPESGSALTRERRQFGPGDWIPLTQPCVTCRPVADNGDVGRRNEDIGLTPPRPPTVTRQIHKSTFFPGQDESSILSVPPPPVFNRNQVGNANLQGTRFPNFLQQFNSGNSLQFDSQSVFPQAQFLSQPFLGSTSLLGSNYPEVLPLLNNPALLVQANIGPTQDIKTQKINQEGKAPNLQENVIIEQNRQQQHHHVKNQQVPSPVPGLQLPLTNPPVEFAPNRQQQSILEGNILTPPPVPNGTFPDVIIPGLDKEEIQLLYVPLETLKQRTHHSQHQHRQQQQSIHQQQGQQQQSIHQQQGQQQHQIHQQQGQQQHQIHQQQGQQQHQIHQQQAQQQHQVHQQHNIQQQQHQAAQRHQQQQQQNQIHQQQQHHNVQHQQLNQHQLLQSHQQQHEFQHQQQQQGVQHQQQQQQHRFQQQQIVQNQHHKAQQHAQQIHQEQRVTPSAPSIKFTQQQQSVRTSEHPSTPLPAGHFITHSATPAPHTVGSTFQTFPVTPSTLFFQHQPFQSSQAPVGSSTPSNPTFQTFLTPSPLTQKFSAFPSATPSENLVTVPEKFQFSQEFVTTPNTIVDQVPFKDAFGKDFVFDGISHSNKFKSFSIQQQEEQQKQFLLQQQKEEEEQQKLLQQEQEKKLLEQQERERLHQEKVVREQQERERQQKIQREQQEQERKQKLIKEQQERERQEKIAREQQERERQQKIAREQQERERQQKIAREQQERERQQKIAREKQERERQQKIAREQQERERQQKLYREQQERERQQKLLREQQEREHQQKLYREQVEHERQQKILREQQERERQHKILLEQQERERQQKLLLEQQEREHQQKLLLEQQERERQENILREQQERERQQQQLLFEQQERERQEKILLEERRQKELLIKQQQEREQQLLLQEQEERERQLLLNQQQQYLVQQQQLTQPLPTQFNLQAQEQLAVTPQFEVQTEVPDDSLVPHQPPLSVFYGGGKGQPRIGDVLKELRGAKTISVLDQYLENIPKVFVGPANLRPPKGYGKFELPYLSNIDVNRVERKVDKHPFFVAPLNFIPPSGYAKIPFPAPHVGSVVVSTEGAVRQSEKGSTPPPYVSTLRTTLNPRPRPTTQSPPTALVQQIVSKQRFKENRPSNPLLPNPEQINELRTEAIITTTIIPETTTQLRGRRPYYRTKARRPTNASNLQTTRSPETVENAQFQKTETVERKPSLKFPKQRRQRVKTTTENPEFDSVNSANRQFLVETSPSPASHQQIEREFNHEFFQQENGRHEVQGIFEVDTRHESKVDQPSTETVANTDFHVPTQSALTTLGLEVVDNAGFTGTTQKSPQTTLQGFEPTQKTNGIEYSRFGQTDYFFTTQRAPTSVEIENAGVTGFFDQTPRIPVGVESNGDSGFYNQHSFGSSGGDNSFFTTGQSSGKEASFGKFENTYFQDGGKVVSDNSERGGFFQQQQKQSVGEIENEQVSFQQSVTGKPPQEYVRSTQNSISFQTYYPDTEATTESVKHTTPFPSEKINENIAHDINVQYVEVQKTETEASPTLPPTTTTTTTEAPRSKSRFRTKSRGQVNFATSQASTQSPYVRKRVVYKTRVHKEEVHANGTEEVRTVPKYRGLRKGYQTSTESAVEYDGSRTAKPQRRTSSAGVVRRRKPTTERPNYPPNFNYEYSPSGVSNDVFDDQIRESSLSRNHYAENAVSFTATTSTTTTTPVPVTAEVFTRRRDDFAAQKTEEIPTENYPKNFPSEVYVTDISRVTPSTRQTTVSAWERNQEAEEEDQKKFLEAKKAFDPSLEKKNARRRIRVRVHKRPHEQIETAESQNFGTVANALVPPTPAKPSVEPDLYRFSKTGFNFDQSDKFAGTKNQAYVRNITSDILENTAAFSAPGVESETDVKKVTIVTEDKPTTTEFVPETTVRSDVEVEKDEYREEVIGETTTEVPVETTTYFTTIEDTETETEEPATTTPTATTTTTTTTTTTPPPATTTEEDASREIQLSTATEISHETEICFRGKCIKTNSATADDDLRKLVQSADKVLIT